MKEYLQLINTETEGPRCDVTPLFADPGAFVQMVSDLCEPFLSVPLDFVVGIDALGFILGTAAAIHLEKGFIPIRKGGKLPVPVISESFIDYSIQSKTLEIRQEALKPGDRVLIVDEWIETGTQVQAAITLIEKAGASVVGIATINMDENPNTARLRSLYVIHTLL